MQNDWITMATLGTFGGVVFAVTLICQFLKDILDQYVKMPTRLMVLLVAWCVLFGRQYVWTGHLEFATVYLDLVNGFLVALAAIGTHAIAKDHLNWK